MIHCMIKPIFQISIYPCSAISIYPCNVISIYRAKIATNTDIQEDTLWFLRVIIGLNRYTLPAGVKLLRRCSELMVLYYVLSFILGQCFKFNFVTMMQDGQITPTATILTWIQSTMVLISVIASLIAGYHLYSKHRGNMRKLGLALILVFMVWLICSNLLPVAVFYLAGNTQQAAFTCMNLISMITTTSTYIYAYYRMYRAIKTTGCIGQ